MRKSFRVLGINLNIVEYKVCSYIFICFNIHTCINLNIVEYKVFYIYSYPVLSKY